MFSFSQEVPLCTKVLGSGLDLSNKVRITAGVLIVLRYGLTRVGLRSKFDGEARIKL